MATLIPRPQPGEYRDYASAYVSLVQEGGRIADYLQAGAATMQALIRAYPPDKLTVPHEPGEWTVQDVLQHVIDQERVFSYRLLAIARGDQASLPGFDQEEYAAAAGANARRLDHLLTEYRAVRDATISLVRALPDAVMSNTGTSDGHPLSARAAAYILVGHELYHLDSLRQNYGDYT